MSSNTISIEKNTPFSQSILWQLQAEYFEKQGIIAWNGQVPFFITSNPYIADRYAHVIIRFIQDCIRHGHDQTKPFYIIELGTGSGQFSYYCLKSLQKLQQQLHLDHIDICYVMTDFTEANLTFWLQHEALLPFVEKGLLDFATYNLEAPSTIQLHHKKINLDHTQATNPAILIANYIFDTVQHDIFRMKSGKLHETLVNVSCKPGNMHQGKPIELEHVLTHFNYRELTSTDYYDNPTLNQILEQYTQQLENGHFLFPVGAFKCIEYFEQIFNQGLMVLATDKAYTDLFELTDRKAPTITFHGSLSMTVNFHTIGKYCQLRHGQVKHQLQSDSIRSSVFMLGLKDTFQPIETNVAICSHLHHISPGDYFRLHRHVRESDKFDIRIVQTQLHACHWDPYVLKLHLNQLVKTLPQSDQRIVEGFITGLDIARHNIYSMPNMADHYFNIGMILHAVYAYEKAITCYRESISRFGDKFSNHYNLGLCYHMLNNDQHAIEHFSQADRLEQNGQQAKTWLDKLKKKR
mgnify:CR=1 FL=1